MLCLLGLAVPWAGDGTVPLLALGACTWLLGLAVPLFNEEGEEAFDNALGLFVPFVVGEGELV